MRVLIDATLGAQALKTNGWSRERQWRGSLGRVDGSGRWQRWQGWREEGMEPHGTQNGWQRHERITMSVELMIRMVAWMKAVAWTAMAEQAAGAWMVASVGNIGRVGNAARQ